MDFKAQTYPDNYDCHGSAKIDAIVSWFNEIESQMFSCHNTVQKQLYSIALNQVDNWLRYNENIYMEYGLSGHRNEWVVATRDTMEMEQDYYDQCSD